MLPPNLTKLNTLLTKDLNKILQQEQDNENRVNMYGVGEYWVAFQRSAYLLECITHKKEDRIVLHLDNYPFPVVMHNIHYNKVNDMCRSHIATKKTLEFLQLTTTPINEQSYIKWFRKILKDNE